MTLAHRAGTGADDAGLTRPAREYLTPTEVAAILRRTPKTLRDWRYKGTGPAYVAGRPTLYARADVDAWIAARRRAN